jgi:hypothetical protein
LIAEDVAKINPALVLPDKEGKPYTVRYDAVNAMLLNEFLQRASDSAGTGSDNYRTAKANCTDRLRERNVYARAREERFAAS